MIIVGECRWYIKLNERCGDGRVMHRHEVNILVYRQIRRCHIDRKGRDPAGRDDNIEYATSRYGHAIDRCISPNIYGLTYEWTRIPVNRGQIGGIFAAAIQNCDGGW